MADGNENNAWLEISDLGAHTLSGSCSIGRSSANQVVLGAEKVSRRHAIVNVAENGEHWLVDLGSSKGTYINGKRLAQPTLLKDEDEVHIGDFILIFHNHGSPTDAGHDDSISDKTIQDIRAADCWLLLADIESSTELSIFHPPDELPKITGRWLERCKEIIEANDGSINKFLGDGFFAYWRHENGVEMSVSQALEELRELQDQKDPCFRVILHFGRVFSGGGATMGEESLSGKEVNFVFRMEKKAPEIGISRMMSQPAHDKLAELVKVKEAGSHGLSGFEGEFPFFEF